MRQNYSGGVLFHCAAYASVGAAGARAVPNLAAWLQPTQRAATAVQRALAAFARGPGPEAASAVRTACRQYRLAAGDVFDVSQASYASEMVRASDDGAEARLTQLLMRDGQGATSGPPPANMRDAQGRPMSTSDSAAGWGRWAQVVGLPAEHHDDRQVADREAERSGYGSSSSRPGSRNVGM